MLILITNLYLYINREKIILFNYNKFKDFKKDKIIDKTYSYSYIINYF